MINIQQHTETVLWNFKFLIGISILLETLVGMLLLQCLRVQMAGKQFSYLTSLTSQLWGGIIIGDVYKVLLVMHVSMNCRNGVEGRNPSNLMHSIELRVVTFLSSLVQEEQG